SSIIVPITNVMNDQYCYQTSKKIRQVFDYKRRNGQYIGAFAPYGYVKHPKDKHRLIIDPDAAEIVKLIFSLFLKGTSKRAIALYLNEHGVPSPSAYKLQKGIPVSTRGYDDPMWGARMIHSILTNPTYTGDLAQGRSRVKSYKVHEVESVPREEWVEVAGTHESIIDYETFDKVQALLQRDTRTSPKGREVHLFSGFLKCADCGRAITRSVGNNNNVYYACSTYKSRSRTACTMHSIKHNRLEAAVLFAVQQQIHLAVSYSEMIARINTAPVKKSQSI
ncbi:recombinase family protein, partial [Anaerotruncus colihominis]